MHGGTVRRAAWRGWLLSILLHAAVAAGLVCALRHTSLPAAPGIADTRWPEQEVNLTIWDEPIRIAAPKPAPSEVARAPTGPIVPVYVAAKPLGSGSVPELRPVDPQSVSAKPAAPSLAAPNNPGDVRQVSHQESVAVADAGGTASQLPLSAAAKSVVFVLDRSASMGIDDRIALARTQIIASLRRLPATARFQVVVYNRQVETIPVDGKTGLVPVTARSIEQLAAALEELTPEGGNDHGPALRAALALEPDEICLLTDADDLTLELVNRVTAWNRGHSVIHAVTIGSAPRQAMKQLADWNRGICAAIGQRH